jgi:hypothetical protein
MQIVLPGALPPNAAIATALAQHLPTVAPTLFAWMRLAPARQQPLDPHEHGCTPFEAWQLAQAGFQPQAGQRLGAGLGPLRAGHATAPGKAVWIADLAHVAISLEHTALLPAPLLNVTAIEGAALFEAAQPLLQETPFQALAVTPYRWQIHSPDTLTLPTISPAALMSTPHRDWWHQEIAARPWRHLVNGIQMVWHDHPVNLARIEQSQLPINMLWLYGGSIQWPQPALPTSPSCLVFEDLLTAALTEDWHHWLSTLQRLDSTLFKPHADRTGAPTRPLTLTLFGCDRCVELSLQPRGRLCRWLPTREQDWRTWWSVRG